MSKHARHAAADSTATVTTRTRGHGSRGRHSAAPQARRRKPSAPVSPRVLPLSLGLGIAVTMATTTGLAVASGTPSTLFTGAPDGAAPAAAGDTGLTAAMAGAVVTQGTTATDAARDVAASRNAARDAVASRDQASSRDQAASRSGVRAAPAEGVVVSADAKLTAEKMLVDVEAAPEPILPGCEGEATGAGSNGQISSSELCSLWDGGPAIRADAAVALARLNQEFAKTFGEQMCVTDGYRSYSQQVATKAAKGYLAATPGTSNHGWGLAVDLCPETYAGERGDWLAAHAPEFGWDNPPWARPGGSKYEPWHWEFTAAVEVANAR